MAVAFAGNSTAIQEMFKRPGLEHLTRFGGKVFGFAKLSEQPAPVPCFTTCARPDPKANPEASLRSCMAISHEPCLASSCASLFAGQGGRVLHGHVPAQGLPALVHWRRLSDVVMSAIRNSSGVRARTGWEVDTCLVTWWCWMGGAYFYITQW